MIRSRARTSTLSGTALLLAAATAAVPASAGTPLGTYEVPTDGRMWLVDAADIQARARVDRFAGRDEAEACLQRNGVKPPTVPDSAPNAKKTRNVADRMLELTGRAAKDPSKVAEPGRCATLAVDDTVVQPSGLRLYERILVGIPWRELANLAVGKDEAGTPVGKPSDSCSWTFDLHSHMSRWTRTPAMLDVEPPQAFDLFRDVYPQLTVVDRE